MAIDTQAKRRSAGAHLVATTYPIPNGSITAPDRLHVSWLYSGIGVEAPIVVPFGSLGFTADSLVTSLTFTGDKLVTALSFTGDSLVTTAQITVDG